MSLRLGALLALPVALPVALLLTLLLLSCRYP